MALVQALPISAEPHNPGLSVGARRRHPSCSSPPINAPPSALEPMGSVSSLVATRPGPYLDPHSGAELGARVRRQTPGASYLGSESPQDPLLHNILHLKKQSSSTSSRGPEREAANGNYTYLNEDYVDDWNDNRVMANSPGGDVDEIKVGSGINGNMEGPPPKLIPVSGKLEKVRRLKFSFRYDDNLAGIVNEAVSDHTPVSSLDSPPLSRTWRRRCCGPPPSNPSSPRAAPPCSTCPLATLPARQRARAT